jgi:hypothetical protein
VSNAVTDILEQLYDFDGHGITASDRYHMRMMAGKEIERLRIENWQLKGALGYPVPGNIPEGDFKCGLCDARRTSQSSGLRE